MMHIVFYYFDISIFHKCQLAVYLTGVTSQKLKRDKIQKKVKRDQEEKSNFNVDFKILTPDNKLVNKRDSSNNVELFS